MPFHDRRNADTELIGAIGELKSTVVALHETTQKLEHRLYGNGQPGDIEKIDTRLITVENHQTRMTGWIAGAVAVLAAIVAGAEFLFHYVFPKKV